MDEQARAPERRIVETFNLSDVEWFGLFQGISPKGSRTFIAVAAIEDLGDKEFTYLEYVEDSGGLLLVTRRRYNCATKQDLMVSAFVPDGDVVTLAIMPGRPNHAPSLGIEAICNGGRLRPVGNVRTAAAAYVRP